MSGKRTNLIASILFLLTAIGLLIYNINLMYHYPLFDFAVTDFGWLREWFYMFAVSFYSTAACMCVVALLNEPPIQGFLWSVSFLFIGGSSCCIYVCYRLLFKELRFVTNEELKDIAPEEERLSLWDRVSANGIDDDEE